MDKLSDEEKTKMQGIANTFKALRNQVSQLASKLTELDADRAEHKLVGEIECSHKPAKYSTPLVCYRIGLSSQQSKICTLTVVVIDQLEVFFPLGCF